MEQSRILQEAHETALSQINENRKVWTRKSLIFQYTFSDFASKRQFCDRAAVGAANPGPGLIEAACQKYPAITLEHAFLAGNAVAAVQLANARGMRAFGIGLDVEGLQYARVASLCEVVARL
jgi:histidinol phosphatase-like enzyme